MKKVLIGLCAMGLLAGFCGCGEGATEEATEASGNLIKEGVTGAEKGMVDAEKAVGKAVRKADDATFGKPAAPKKPATTPTKPAAQ